MARFVGCMLVAVLLSVGAAAVHAQICSATDSSALQYFYREFVYARTEFSTWDPTTNCCGWTGVTCDGSGNVVKLDIENPNATLPYPQGALYLMGTGILGMKYLVSLKMKNVAFNGGIPPSWGTGLTNIQVLILNGCNIVGPLPPSLCSLSAMTNFSMAKNLLTGTLDNCFATPSTTFPKIQLFDISGNNFT